jgi:hypothetical protein
MDFAIVVIIGLRFKVLHRACLPDILSTRTSTDVIKAVKSDGYRFDYDSRAARNDCELWKKAGISVVDTKPESAWVDIEVTSDSDTDGILNVMEPTHRPTIAKAFGWIADLASQKGEARREGINHEW